MKAKEVRSNSRELLGNKIFKEKWMTALLFCLIVSAATSITAATMVGAIVTIAIIGPLTIACAKVFVDVVRGKEPKANIKDVFYGFKNKFWKNVGVFWYRELFIFLWSLLFIIPGIIKAYAYSMVPYLIAEDENLGVKDAMKKSIEMMKGNKWRMFCLDLSFIGWFFVSILTLGAGFLWLAPYVETSHAVFYNELASK